MGGSCDAAAGDARRLAAMARRGLRGGAAGVAAKRGPSGHERAATDPHEGWAASDFGALDLPDPQLRRCLRRTRLHRISVVEAPPRGVGDLVIRLQSTSRAR